MELNGVGSVVKYQRTWREVFGIEMWKRGRSRGV